MRASENDAGILTAEYLTLDIFFSEPLLTCLLHSFYVGFNRYKGLQPVECGVFVCFTNGLWVVFPLLGMWASYEMIHSDSFAVFL